MSGSDPWGDLGYLLNRKGQSAAFASLIEPFKPRELLALVRQYHASFPATQEMKLAADAAETLWWEIHEVLVSILAYSGRLDGTEREEYWQEYGRKDDHLNRLKSISVHAAALAKLLSKEPTAVQLHNDAGGKDHYQGMRQAAAYIKRLGDVAAAYGSPEEVQALRDDEFYAVSDVRRTIWDPVFDLYLRRFGKLPRHRASQPFKTIALLHDILGLEGPNPESLMSAQASFIKRRKPPEGGSVPKESCGPH